MTTYITRVLPIADAAAQEEALALLAQEQIFAAPTDTVYGIFARPDSPTAIERIYIAKGRPPQKAIPILIGTIDHLEEVARPPWSSLAAPLMARFWPGALTLILPSQPHLPSILTAGQPTVAVRMPSHATLCALLQRSGPLAATSANRSGGADTHSAQEVLAQLDGSIPLILSDESQASQQNLPSTLVDLTGTTGPRILRAGQLFAEVSALLTELVGAQDQR